VNERNMTLKMMHDSLSSLALASTEVLAGRRKLRASVPSFTLHDDLIGILGRELDDRLGRIDPL